LVDGTIPFDKFISIINYLLDEIDHENDDDEVILPVSMIGKDLDKIFYLTP
jgi:hypothetical protein